MLLQTLQVHGKLYKSLFNTDPEVGLIASGFAIRNGQWRFNSGTFNFWQPSRYTMDSTEQIFIKVSTGGGPSAEPHASTKGRVRGLGLNFHASA